ncbi:inositol monophosphatase [Dactylosporangium vinaceum]|uniref:Inositol-1-monophosphatase n=1 Tax=Dactylosporangium vinaceum TaxID=53362 RepID=A0ABV5LYJ2_9ACTN|nr:inositol monophosphatase family protein [Dactylosporangium vinaceum]UAB98237.1 inositol monophosphatase [Dactylosporangium vinaceum]
MNQSAELLALAVSVARAAGDLATRMRADGVAAVATKSTATDVVTAADRAVEQLVRDRLREARPGDVVFGEEYGGGQERAAVRWILDPIDGTVNYLYDIPVYAVSLAAEVDGVVVAGVVINAATGREWTATLGGGAYCGDRRLRVSGETDLGQALVGTGFGYAAGRRLHQARVLTGLIGHIRDVRRIGAASIDLCLVAEGALDAYYEKGLNPWDHAAGGLVAAEAGALVTGLDGNAPGVDMVIAAPPALHAQLHDLLSKLDASGGP